MRRDLLGVPQRCENRRVPIGERHAGWMICAGFLVEAVPSAASARPNGAAALLYGRYAAVWPLALRGRGFAFTG